MATLDELVVRIKADASQLEREMKRAGGVTRQESTKMSGALVGLRSQFLALVPPVSVAALIAFGRSAIATTGHIQDLAGRTGIAATTLFALRTPLEQSGTSLEEFSASVNRMNNMIGEAAKGTNREAIKSFDNLHLSVQKLVEMTPEEQLYAVTKAIMEQGTQAKITNAGMDIFGKTFSSMQPALKDHQGNLRAIVDEQERLNKNLAPEDIDRIDKFGDSMTKSWNDAETAAMKYFAVLLRISDWITNHMTLPGLEQQRLKRNQDEYSAWAKANGGVTEPTVVSGYSFDAAGNLTKQKDPKNDLGLDAAQEMLQKLRQENARSSLPPGQRAGQEAADQLRLLALKDKNVHVTQEMIDQAYTLAEANYEANNPNPITEYITKLEQERDVLQTAKEQQAGLKAYYDILNQAKRDHIDISEEEKQKIMQLADANEQLSESQHEAERAAKQMHDQMRDGLTDIILHFDKAGDAAKAFFDEIASSILKRSVTGPLVDGLIGSSGTGGLIGSLFRGTEMARPSPDFVGPMPTSGGFLSGLGSLLGFADGGDPPVGRPSWVGERGPEIFVPRAAGTVIPNHALGGSGPSVVHNWNIAAGVTRQELASMIPMIEQRSTAATLAAMEKGGKASQIVGRRS